MKKIAKNQKAAAIIAETDLQNVGGGGCPTCGLVLQLDRNWLIDPVVPQLNPGQLGGGIGIG
jgi:hypothetical protein